MSKWCKTFTYYFFISFHLLFLLLRQPLLTIDMVPLTCMCASLKSHKFNFNIKELDLVGYCCCITLYCCYFNPSFCRKFRWLICCIILQVYHFFDIPLFHYYINLRSSTICCFFSGDMCLFMYFCFTILW